jgi:phage FluMu protein gp41
MDKFFSYDSATGIFEEKSIDSIRKELARRIFKAAIEWKNLFPGLDELRNEVSLRGVVQHLKGLTEERDAFAKDLAVMHLRNCDLRITIDGFSPEPISPKSRARSRLPFDYLPDADCPRFKNELLGPLESDQLIVLQKAFALYLTGENPLHKIVILDREAGSGKTEVALTFQKIFGPDKAGALRTSFLEDRFELGRIYDKNLLIGADVGSQFLQEYGAGALKKLTGGDYLEAELKISNRRLSLYGRFNVLITSNVRLKIRLADDAAAWLRRLIVIRYRRTRRNRRILDFHKVLVEEEGPGILNWGLAGLELLRKDIAETGDIVLSDEMRRTVQALVEESDGLRLFLKSNVERNAYSDVSVDELVIAFTNHCQSLNWSVEPVGSIQRSLESLMLELFSSRKRNDIERFGKSVRGFKGVRLSKTEKDPSEASDEDL